jgi:hypothetical protein
MTDLLTAASVVVHAPDTHVTDLDGEKVLYVPARQTLHQLDQTASLVWDCLSAAATLDEVATDLAVAFAMDKPTMLSDIIVAMTVLVDAGALIAEGGTVVST